MGQINIEVPEDLHLALKKVAAVYFLMSLAPDLHKSMENPEQFADYITGYLREHPEDSLLDAYLEAFEVIVLIE